MEASEVRAMIEEDLFFDPDGALQLVEAADRRLVVQDGEGRRFHIVVEELPGSGQAIPSAPDVIARYPRLLAHMVCESRWTLSSYGAAKALRDYIQGRPSLCKWFFNLSHSTGCSLADAPKAALGEAFARRHQHRDYSSAKAQVYARKAQTAGKTVSRRG